VPDRFGHEGKNMSEITSLFGKVETPPTPKPEPVDTTKVNAFQVISSPIVISGVEGRVTKETGPFMVSDKKQLETMVTLVRNGVLKTVNVDRKDVRMLDYGAKIQVSNPAIQLTSQGLLVDKLIGKGE
jgi:hypothetical protein